MMLTRTAQRHLLEKVLRSDSDLDAFVSDHFPEVHYYFTNGMDRVQKTTILLTHVKVNRLIEALRQAHPTRMKSYEEHAGVAVVHSSSGDEVGASRTLDFGARRRKTVVALLVLCAFGGLAFTMRWAESPSDANSHSASNNTGARPFGTAVQTGGSSTPRLRVTLEIVSTPPGVTIALVDQSTGFSRELGVTPWSGEITRPASGFARLLLRSPGYQDQIVMVNLPNVGVARATVALEHVGAPTERDLYK